jgi:light-regulated signal transduction histidine kinase (bacteriophytochrome)
VNELTQTSSDPIEWSSVSAFVRQWTHDILNDLGVIELEAELLNETSKRRGIQSTDFAGLRHEMSGATNRLRRVSRRFQPVSLQIASARARDVMEAARELTERAGRPESRDSWICETEVALADVDPARLAEAIHEIVANAIQFRECDRPIKVIGRQSGSYYRIEVIESKARVPETVLSWGVSPLSRARQDAYGMGLNYALRIVQAHAGTIEREFDAAKSMLTTAIVLQLPTSAGDPVR